MRNNLTEKKKKWKGTEREKATSEEETMINRRGNNIRVITHVKWKEKRGYKEYIPVEI